MKIWIGMGAGAIWALFLLWVGAGLDLPVFTLVPTVMGAFLAPGLVMMLMIGWVSLHQAFRETVEERGRVCQQVLRDTVQQLVLALCVWPAAAVILQGDGPGVIVALGLGLAFARVAFWAGAHVSAPLRAFGFAASFYPTVAVSAWALFRLLANFSAP